MKLILSDGTEFENSSVILFDASLFVYIRGQYTMKDVFDAFYGNQQNIIFDDGVKQVKYDGYHVLIAVRQEAADFVSAVLKKE